MSDSIRAKKIGRLPLEARKQVSNFVDFLYERYGKQPKPTNDHEPVSESSFFGIWKDRPEMSDSVAWVMRVRQSQ